MGLSVDFLFLPVVKCLTSLALPTSVSSSDYLFSEYSSSPLLGGFSSLALTYLSMANEPILSDEFTWLLSLVLLPPSPPRNAPSHEFFQSPTSLTFTTRYPQTMGLSSYYLHTCFAIFLTFLVSIFIRQTFVLGSSSTDITPQYP